MANYSVKVTGKLDTSNITSDLDKWKSQNGTIKLNVDDGKIISTIDRLQDGFGKVATVTQANGKTIATITDNTKKWAEQQDNLRSRVTLSSQQLTRMSEVANQLTGTWGQNGQAVAQLQSRITALQSSYNGLASSSEALDSARVRQLNNEQREIQESINLLRTQSQNMQSSFGSVATFAAQFISVQKAIQLTISMISNMVEEVFKLDASLTELAKVSNMTKSEMGGLTDQAFELGDAIGRTGQEVVDATATFKQAGYEMQESFDLAETALVMTNIADGMDDVGEASTNLVSIMKGFNLSVNDSEHIIDSFNNVNIDAFSYGNI